MSVSLGHLDDWYMILGEPMQVIDETLTMRGKHIVWLRGPRHIYARQRAEVQDAECLTIPATQAQVAQAAARWADMLRKDMGQLAALEKAV